MNAYFRMDNLSETSPEYYVEVKRKGNKLEVGTGWPDSIRRTSVTFLTRRQARALAGALQTLSDTLDEEPLPEAQGETLV